LCRAVRASPSEERLAINASTGLIGGTVAAGAALDGTQLVAVTASDGTYDSTQLFWWPLLPATAPAATP
jgi:hypothetical protein